GISPSISSHPINDLLLCILMGMLVTDVAVRRIHWDWTAMKHWAYVGVAQVKGFTTMRKIDAAPTLAALHRVHQNIETRRSRAMHFQPEPLAAFNVKATSPKPIAQSSLNSLKAAKQRAIEEIRKKQQGGNE